MSDEKYEWTAPEGAAKAEIMACGNWLFDGEPLDPASPKVIDVQPGEKHTIEPSSYDDFVPLSVRHGNRRKKLNWWLKGRRERLALRIAPWVNGRLASKYRNR